MTSDDLHPIGSIDTRDDDVLEDDAESEGVSHFELRATNQAIDERLDKFIAAALSDFSRAYLQQLIDNERVLVDGIPRRRSFKLTPGDVVTVDVPAPIRESIEPESIPLNVIYEDQDLIVLNKRAGMVVHPAPGHPRGTLVNALLAHAPDIAVSGTNRPGIVHRLDKDTSGLMVVAKNDRAKLALIAQWHERSVAKHYVALVRDVVEPDEATIDAPIGRDPLQRKRMATMASGRAAVTHFRVRQRYEAATLLDLELETGRTHQIRVHLAFIGHPIVGDPVYNRAVGPTGGARSMAPRQFLHSTRLGFRLPGGQAVSFEVGLPLDLQTVLDRLE